MYTLQRSKSHGFWGFAHSPPQTPALAQVWAVWSKPLETMHFKDNIIIIIQTEIKNIVLMVTLNVF